MSLGAVGAIDAYKMPCVIIDMGTASTVSVLDRSAAFLGGMIAAGVQLTLKALTENTSQLPAIPLEAPRAAIGSNTVECMQSGLIYGTAAMIDGLLERIEEELGEPHGCGYGRAFKRNNNPLQKGHYI